MSEKSKRLKTISIKDTFSSSSQVGRGIEKEI
jgi:hypothetical protein